MAHSDRLRIAQEFAAWVRGELGRSLVRVVLFGSVARGDDREGSDIDLLVEVKGDLVSARRRLGHKIMEIAASEGVFVSAFVHSAEDGARAPPYGIYKVIDKEGRALA